MGHDKEYSKRWYQEHKESHLINTKRYYYEVERKRLLAQGRVCQDCGKPLIKQSASRCSCCSRLYEYASGKRAHSKGKNNPNWKGGKVKGGHGYIRLHRPSHPRANKNGYVLEHILIWEQTHGKPLPKGWIIHHLNGMPSDNRPHNLVALPNRKHYLVLQAKAKRIQELEAILNNQHQLL